MVVLWRTSMKEISWQWKEIIFTNWCFALRSYGVPSKSKNQWDLQELGKHWTYLVDPKFGRRCQISPYFIPYYGQIFLQKKFPKFSWVVCVIWSIFQNFHQGPRQMAKCPQRLLKVKRQCYKDRKKKFLTAWHILEVGGKYGTVNHCRLVDRQVILNNFYLKEGNLGNSVTTVMQTKPLRWSV